MRSDPHLVLLPASTRHRGRTFVAFGFTTAGCVLLVVALHAAWDATPLLLLGAVPLARGLRLLRTRLEVDENGISTPDGSGRVRSTAWTDVDHLEHVLVVDDLGGRENLPLESGLLRLHRRDGTQLVLPRLDDAEAVRVLATTAGLGTIPIVTTLLPPGDPGDPGDPTSPGDQLS